MTVQPCFPFLCVLAWSGLPTPAWSEGRDQVDSIPMVRSDEIAFEGRGSHLPSLALARESALEAARDRLAEILRERGIQRDTMPSLDWIDRELVRHGMERKNYATPDDDGPKLVQLTLHLKLSPSHMRTFRKMERTSLSAIGVGLIAVVFLASWLYYRLDEWSKGYLTSWLAIGLVFAGILVGGVWWWLHS